MACCQGRLRTHHLPSALLIGLAAALAGCAPGDDASGTMSPPSAAVANLQPDSRGVISYATYQVAVARDGDTVQTVATRVGTTPAALAQRNALPTDYRMRAGEVLLLPDGVPRADPLGGDGVTTQPLAWSPERTAAAIDGAPATATPQNPFQNGQTDPLIDPVRHRVESGETAYSIARLYGVSVTALSSWNGLGPDLAVRTGQELLIPIVSDANRISGGIDDNQPGQVTPVAPPPSAATPLPQDMAAAPQELASPNLGAQRTPPGGRLSSPVSGTVSRPFNAANPNGIGFAVPAGTPVKAAAGGEVARISEELGGLGAIMLIRHQDDLLTTYSTLSDVRGERGQTVQAGTVIGTVAPRDRPELQFDGFRGTTAVDPTPYVGN